MIRTTSQKSHRKGEPLPLGERATLSRFVEAIGERLVLTALQVNGQTLARALAGMTIYRGSAALIRLGIERLAAQARREKQAEGGRAP